MVGGVVVTSLALGALGWTREVVSLFSGDGRTKGEEEWKAKVVIFVAVGSIYVLDFAINAVQACCRSIIVDVLPTLEQQTGSAWAARMAASGHVIGFFIGTLPLVDILPAWIGGDTQFKKMVFVAVVGLWGAVGVTCWAVRERPLVRRPEDDLQQGGTFVVLGSLWTRMWNLPERIQMICWCQFWGWIGWFPFLFYSSTWVGETYYRYEHPEQAAGTPGADNHDALGNIGRLGSLSLVLFSAITFASSVLLPYMVRKPEETEHDPTASASRNGKKASSSRGRFTPRPPPSLGKNLQAILLKIYESPKPDLVTTWGLSNLCFAAIMVWAPFVQSLRFATTLVALCGVPWAVSCWAPFAEMGVEINRLAHGGSAAGVHGVIPSGVGGRGAYTAVRPSFEADGDDDDIELQTRGTGRSRAGSSGNMGLLQADHDSEHGNSSGELAGVYLGVLNVYTTLPQFVGTFVSWIVFSLLEPGKNEAGAGGEAAGGGAEHEKYLKLKGVNSIAVCLFIGAVCAVGAAEATRRLKRMSS